MSKLRGNLVDPSGQWPPQEKAGKGEKVFLILFRNYPINQVLLGSRMLMLLKQMPIHHSHKGFFHISIAISRNHAQIHCSGTPTNFNMPVCCNSARIGHNGMPTQRNSVLIHHNRRPTDCNSTPTNH